MLVPVYFAELEKQEKKSQSEIMFYVSVVSFTFIFHRNRSKLYSANQEYSIREQQWQAVWKALSLSLGENILARGSLCSLTRTVG